MKRLKVLSNYLIRPLAIIVGLMTSVNAHAGNANSVTLGTGATATNNYDVALGSGAVASGDGSAVNMATAIGSGAQALKAGSIAIGDAWQGGEKATGRDSIAIGTTTTATQQSAVAIGMDATATQANAVALGAGSITSAAVATSGTTINGTSYTFAGTTPTSTISVGSAGNERTVTNVAAGRLSATSTDAVNGSELYATDSAITSLGTQTTALGNSIASGLGGSSTYNSSTGALSTSLSYDGATYNSVQSVLNQIDTSVNGSGIKYLHANSTLADSSATGTNSVAVGPVATASTRNAVAIGNGATAGANAGDVALGAGSTTSTVVATSGTTIGGNAYTFAGATPTSTVSVGAAGSERTVTNVAAGRISATSTDAVNGSELYATNQQVSSNTAAISNLSSAVNNLATGGANNKYYQVNGNGTASSATGTNAVAAGSAAVAAGANSTAVGNGSKASAASSTVVGEDASASGTNSVAIGANSNDGGESNVVSVGSSSQQRRITHVADGTAVTDAVNVGQLDAAQADAVQYDRNSDGSVDYGSVTLGSNGTPAQIHDVANGTATNDAVNLGQLNAGVQSAENWAKNYTDQQVQNINQNLNVIAARANAGVASAMAMAGLPQAYRPNQNAAAVALGTFHGQTGIAVGVSSVSESGRWVYKLNLTGNTRGDAGASVGAAMTW
jgi:trimeric autotransporter adhesin